MATSCPSARETSKTNSITSLGHAGSYIGANTIRRRNYVRNITTSEWSYFAYIKGARPKAAFDLHFLLQNSHPNHTSAVEAF